MANFPVQFLDLFFINSSSEAIVSHQEFLKEGGEVNLRHHNKIDVEKISGDKKDPDESGGVEYSVSIRTVINPDGDADYPYKINFHCIGYFFVDSTLTDEEAKKAVSITGHSVVYGAIREAIAWVTGRQPYGTLKLGLSILNPDVYSSEDEDKGEDGSVKTE